MGGFYLPSLFGIAGVLSSNAMLPAFDMPTPFGPRAAPIHRRSRNKPERRRLRRNRLHLSRRVRRRHRRRAA